MLNNTRDLTTHKEVKQNMTQNTQEAQELINSSVDYSISEDSTDQSISDCMTRLRLREGFKSHAHNYYKDTKPYRSVA